jgi:hypothetical protein
MKNSPDIKCGGIKSAPLATSKRNQQRGNFDPIGVLSSPPKGATHGHGIQLE